MDAVEQLKVKDKFWEAGELAFETGQPMIYGAHYGMRSTRLRATKAFNLGWINAENLKND